MDNSEISTRWAEVSSFSTIFPLLLKIFFSDFFIQDPENFGDLEIKQFNSGETTNGIIDIKCNCFSSCSGIFSFFFFFFFFFFV